MFIVPRILIYKYSLNRFILMDYPIHNDTISMELFYLKNSADPDEMPLHLDLHCLPKYLFTGIQNKKGLQICHFVSSA